jgi:8-oxo-dGTP diphosphatase
MRVVIGILYNSQGQVLTTKRPLHTHQGGYWEFPGGKLKSGERELEALRRELNEELNINIGHTRQLIRVNYDYTDRQINLAVYHVLNYTGNLSPREQQPLRWVSVHDLKETDFPAANRAILNALRLPSCYFITPEPQQTHHFLQKLRLALTTEHVGIVQLRAHQLNDHDYRSLAVQVFELCQDTKTLLLLNRAPHIATQLPGDGLHLTSKQLHQLSHRPDRSGWIGASCHCATDIAQANRLQLDYALLSPVLTTASHPNAAPLGWQQFAMLTEQAHYPVYALGGMTIDHLPHSWYYGGQGIAAIRTFWPSRCHLDM